MKKECKICYLKADISDGFDLSEHLIWHTEEFDRDIEQIESERKEAQDQLLEIVGEKAIRDLIDFREDVEEIPMLKGTLDLLNKI